MTDEAPCGCLAAKLDYCNSLLSSVHTLLLNILRCVRLYITQLLYCIYIYRNRAEWSTDVRRSATGRPFQTIGPAPEKALSDNSLCRLRRTSNCACAEERNEMRRVYYL